MFSKYIKNKERKNFTRGPHPAHEGGGRAPYLMGPLVALRWPSSTIWGLSMRKNQKPSSRTKLRRHEAKPRWNQSRALAELFCRETSLREGEIIAIIITNVPLIRRGQSPSTSSPAPSPLKTLVHLLYPILVFKSEIGASRLLVVLITPFSWC